MSAPTLANFTAELHSRNIARPNQYYVNIVPPPGMGTENSQLVSMWCSAAQTPHAYLMTNDNFIEGGVRRKYAYDVDYQNLVLNFYMDQDYKIKEFFDEWKKRIVPYNRQFNYPDDYTSDTLELFILDQTDKVTYKYEYKRVVPKTINSIELNYATGNAIVGFNVEFVFEDVYYTSMSSGGSSAPQTQITQDRQNITNAERTQNLNPKSRN